MAQTDKTTIPNGTEEQNASAQTVASPTNIIFENTSVQAINQVDDFDPQAYLLENEDGTKANCLGLQMTWFRLKYPDGKIDPEVVQLTPHGAIFKSTVYKSSEMMQDTFLARSYGSCNSNDAVVGHKYVEAAESIATSRALMRAGFGCQFFDQLGEFEVSQTPGVPESAEETDAEAPPPEVAKAGPADKGKKRAPAKRAAKGETPQVKKSESSNEAPVAASGETPVPVTTNPEGEAEEQVEGQLSLNEPAPSAPAPAPAPAQTAPDPAPVAPAAPPAQPAQSQVSPPPVQQSAPAQAPPAPSAAAPVQGVAQPLGAVPVVAPPPAPAAPPAPPAPPAAPTVNGHLGTDRWSEHYFTSPDDELLAGGFLGQLSTYSDNRIANMCDGFIYDKYSESAHRSWEKWVAPMQKHFKLFTYPKGMERYCDTYVFKKYLFYKKAGRKEYEVECSYCGHRYTSVQAPKHKHEGKCPKCRCQALYFRRQYITSIYEKDELCVARKWSCPRGLYQAQS